MLLDLLIIVFAISALYRGREIGFVRQLCASIGFFGGLFLGALLEPHVVSHAHTQTGRTILTLTTTLGTAFLLLFIGEYIGLRLKRYVHSRQINKYDIRFGSLLNVVALLLSAWLVAAIVASLPAPNLQAAINKSHIISTLNDILPPAPTVIADLGRLIDPNGFPQVFIGSEPAPKGKVDLPSLGDLRAAVTADEASVVKLEGQGCGGIVDGSGFVAGNGLVATNAHVVAGIRNPYVQDRNGTHRGRVVWFDSNLDFAVLRVKDLAGKPLRIHTEPVASGTPAAVLGYPGGGGFSAGTAAVLDTFTASGRNIYGRGTTARDVHEVQATVIPGNSGGPLVARDGSVIGVIFAESTTYQHVGYALATPAVSSALRAASSRTATISSGSCAE